MNENEKSLEYARILKALRKGKYELVSDGHIVDACNRMVCGYLGADGAVEIDYSSTNSVYLGRQMRLHTLLTKFSLPVVERGRKVAIGYLDNQVSEIRNLRARLTRLGESGLTNSVGN